MKRNNKISECIKKNPSQTLTAFMITIMITDMVLALHLATDPSLIVAYLLGIIFLIPCIIIIIITAKKKAEERQREYKDQISSKNFTISGLRQQIKNNQEAADNGKESMRLYQELKDKTQELLDQIEEETHDHNIRESIFRSYYMREDFSQKVYKYTSYIWNHTDALDLFDPIAYLTDRIYNSWVNNNAKKWNEIIESYFYNDVFRINSLRNEIESSKPKRLSSDSAMPDLEKRNNRKMSHITYEKEDR